MSHKKDAEPLKLMPLDEFKKFVQAIVRVPKDSAADASPKNVEKHRDHKTDRD